MECQEDLRRAAAALSSAGHEVGPKERLEKEPPKATEAKSEEMKRLIRFNSLTNINHIIIKLNKLTK